MKRIVISSLVLLFISCAGTQDSSPASIAEIVAQSFYQDDEDMLKKHTTPEGFATFSNLQKMFAKPKGSKSNFKLIDEVIDGEVAWVKYSTSYDKTPGIFKLEKLDGVWKVTVRDPKEKAPF
jgi:accessory colonization factor AcfC